MKKVCVVTSTRADYGLLYHTMKKLEASEKLALEIIVTGMHLSPTFGETWKEIEKDGFEIRTKISLGDLSDSTESVVNQLSTGIQKIFSALQVINPDLVVVLGDRYEILAASQASFFSNIPIAHIHGGEITEGAFDDEIRHSITKLSSYHFTSTDEYKKRVIQMGEFPKRVLNVGAVGLENIKEKKLLSKTEMNEIPFKGKNILMTYHPVTAINENAVDEIIEALKEYNDYGQIITMPNSDPGHEIIMKTLSDYAKNRDNVYITSSLGSLRYLSCLNICDVVIGNSSSGIIEAPFLGTPTLNIGLRQKGRLKEESVIDCPVGEVKDLLAKILKNGKAKKSMLYGSGDSSSQIIQYLEAEDLKRKSGFYDL